MATIIEAYQAVKAGKRVDHSGNYVHHNRPWAILQWDDGAEVPVNAALLTGWTIEEPERETEDVEIDWSRTPAEFRMEEGHRNETAAYTPTTAPACPGFAGYVMEGLEDLPDDELPQQLRVWVRLTRLSFQARYSTHAPSADYTNRYELRRAKAVRMRKND